MKGLHTIYREWSESDGKSGRLVCSSCAKVLQRLGHLRLLIKGDDCYGDCDYCDHIKNLKGAESFLLKKEIYKVVVDMTVDFMTVSNEELVKRFTNIIRELETHE